MRKVIDRDFVSALILLAFGGIFLSVSGTDTRNWIFPRMLIYIILFAGAVLAARVLLGPVVKHVPDLLNVSRDDRHAFVDVFVFCALVLGYILVMNGLGFWLASFIVLVLGSIYLTPEKTPRNLGIAVVVPLAACIVAYFVFLHVFYVPVPTATWWAGFG